MSADLAFRLHRQIGNIIEAGEVKRSIVVVPEVEDVGVIARLDVRI